MGFSRIPGFHLSALALLLALCTGTQALALRDSRPQKLDHRVRTVMYQPDEVFKYVGYYGFQTAIEFAPDESVQTISMGDPTGWMLNPSGNLLFLKPVDQDATTNMTLITNKRTYLIELHGREASGIDDPELAFIYRFTYPDEVDTGALGNYLDTVPMPDLQKDPGKYNMRYTISGSEEVAPLRIFDDGEFTYFEFRGKNAEVPAFYTVDSQGNEAVVNYRTRGNYIVIERVAARFTLRHGNEVVCVFNEKLLPPKK